MIKLTISNKEMEDVVKIIKSFKESGLLMNGVDKTTENEAKEQKRGSPSFLLGTLQNLLTGKDTIQEGKEIIKARQNF